MPEDGVTASSRHATVSGRLRDSRGFTSPAMVAAPRRATDVIASSSHATLSGRPEATNLSPPTDCR